MDFTTTVTALNVLLSADVVQILTEITTMPPVETHMLHVRMVSDSYTGINVFNACIEFIC